MISNFMKGKVYKNDQDRYFFGLFGSRKDNTDQEAFKGGIGCFKSGIDRE